MIAPGATLGVLGGGQLGRMFAQAAHRLGYRVVVLDPDPESPAGAVADEHLQPADFTDRAALAQLAAVCVAVTTEFENVPAEAMAFLAEHTVVRPHAEAVAIAQDRVREKSFFRGIGLATAPFAPISAIAEIDGAIAAVGTPALLKTARFGYDGKGQASITDADDARRAFEQFGSVPCILEGRLRLERELSVVLARGADGAMMPFPPGENVHAHGILDTTVVPAAIEEALAREAIRTAETIARELAYVGVLGVELFVADGGRLFVNEMAPRPHNSGHWTLDAASVCQFEQQVRALAGLPLAPARLRRPACMVNLLGDVWARGEPAWEVALAREETHLHLYGKREPRPGRKMGHLTVLADTAAAALAAAQQVKAGIAHTAR